MRQFPGPAAGTPSARPRPPPWRSVAAARRRLRLPRGGWETGGLVAAEPGADEAPRDEARGFVVAQQGARAPTWHQRIAIRLAGALETELQWAGPLPAAPRVDRGE